MPKLTAVQFENLARKVFSQRFAEPIPSRQIPGVPKLFNLVLLDGDIVDDAKYYTLVGGQHLTPAKFSIISELVWLLEKTQSFKSGLLSLYSEGIAERMFSELTGRSVSPYVESSIYMAILLAFTGSGYNRCVSPFYNWIERGQTDA